MMHDPDTLASAYLDGELTDEERRTAEADPAVMAEVEQLRALRAGLADVEPPTDDARDAAIGAAMAAFHERFGAAPAPAPHAAPERDAVVVPMWQRFASPRWLGTAAAAVVVVVGVGVIATQTGGDDDDSADSSDEPASEMMAVEEPTDDGGDLPDADADRIAESELADETFAAQVAEGDAADDMGMAEEPAEEPADEPAEESADDSDAADDMGDAPAGDAEDGSLLGPPPLDDPSLHFERDVPIVGPLQLRSAAWYLLAQRAEGALGPTPEYRCEFYNVLGSAPFDIDGVVSEVLIEIDEIDRIVYAVERDGCLVVATVDLDER